MASIVEKYEQILAADPKSRIFVELARALLDKGDAPRAVRICERGLEHHPKSILARVIWGRALVELGELKGAMDQFEIAIAIEPANPYAFNLVGEALLKKGHAREAVPVLARAADLQPADTRIQGMLAEAKRLHREAHPDEPTPEAASPGAPAPKGAGELPEGPDGGPEGDSPAPTAAATEPSPETAQAEAARAADEAEGQLETTGAEGRPLEPAAPPPLPKPSAPPALTPAPPPLRRPPPRAPSALDFLPGGREEAPAKPAPQAKRPGPRTLMTTRAIAEKTAEQYEAELRAKAMKEVENERPSFWHRNRLAVLVVGLCVAGAAAGGVYWFVRDRQEAADALVAANRARAGLGRDTRAALGGALDALLAARRRSSRDPDVASLTGQVAAVLAADHEDERARKLLPELKDDAAIGEGAVAVRWALAATKAERAAAAEAVLAAGPNGPPLLQALAGRILVERGEVEAGRGRLEIAARATPPLLRAVVDLGDLALAKGDAEAALASYQQAIAAHPTHPLAVAGAAQARLALGKDLEASKRELAAVDADPGSAPPPAARVRYEVAAARVLAASGEAVAAAERLQTAAQTFGKSVQLSAALAEIHLAGCAWDKAESEAKRVVDLAPKDADGRVLLARARIGKGDWAGALAATERADTRPAHLQRAIARFERGELAKARDELQKTQRDGKMTAEAATWYALTDLALGRRDKAAALLEKLTAAANPPALAFVALGDVRAAEGNPGGAETAYRQAVERDPALPAALSALGRHLLANGKEADALDPLSRTVALDGRRHADRVALAEARLAKGDPRQARRDLDPVLDARPKDPDALRVLAAAWLADKSWGEARRFGERAAAAAPRDPRPLVIAAKAAFQLGEKGTAKKLADRAAKLAPKGKVGDEARRLAAEAAGRKR